MPKNEIRSSLNNIESGTILSHLPSASGYLNVAAFGMKIAHTRALVPEYIRRFNPKCLILLCGTVDFYADKRPADQFDLSDIRYFLNGAPYCLYVAQYFDIRYFLSRSLEIRSLRSKRDTYVSLYFDSYGGVPLEIPPSGISSIRWTDTVRPDLFDNLQYAELEKIMDLCAVEKVGLIVVQSPLRNGSITEINIAGTRDHWDRVQHIVSRAGQVFLETYSRLDLDDSCFVDYSHLNRKGAVALADFVGSYVKQWMKPASSVDLPGMSMLQIEKSR